MRGGQRRRRAAAIAAALHMYYAYGVEYIQSGSAPGDQCTQGNAILSRYPIGQLQLIRFSDQCCTLSNRVGGRMALAGVVDAPNPVQLYSVHLEAGTASVSGVVESAVARVAQSNQLAPLAAAAAANGREVIVGGDFNAPLLDVDPAVTPYLFRGFADALASIPPLDRTTCPNEVLAPFHLAGFDYLLVANGVAGDSAIVNDPATYGLSDHVPIVTTVTPA